MDSKHQDESLLAVSMYLLSRGESEKSVIDLLVNFGWEKNIATHAVRQVSVFSPSQRRQPQPSLVSFLLAWVLSAVLILAVGDYFFILPTQWLWRIVAALSLSLVSFMIFLSIWFFASGKIDR